MSTTLVIVASLDQNDNTIWDERGITSKDSSASALVCDDGSKKPQNNDTSCYLLTKNKNVLEEQQYDEDDPTSQQQQQQQYDREHQQPIPISFIIRYLRGEDAASATGSSERIL